MHEKKENQQGKCGLALCTAGADLHVCTGRLSHYKQPHPELSESDGTDIFTAAEAVCGAAELYRIVPGTGAFDFDKEHFGFYTLLSGISICHRICNGNAVQQEIHRVTADQRTFDDAVDDTDHSNCIDV